jgi:hypothetical protein
MNVLQKAAVAQANWEAFMGEMGHETHTTFYSDFTIADLTGGEKAVRDTYKRARKAWESDIKYLTELVMVLNHKCWEHNDAENYAMSMVYQELWEELHDWCLDNLKDDDLSYYLQTTD